MRVTRHVFDVGNTRIKAGRFEGLQLSEVFYLSNMEELVSFLHDERGPILISSVAQQLDDMSIPARDNMLILTHETPLPIRLDYLTKDTLGKDRIAGAVGAHLEFPEDDCLIIDTGTCVNYDFVDRSGVFHGGVISPGFKMRMQSMHEGTKRLPDISPQYDDILQRFPGKSTIECLRQGVELGLTFEVKGIIDRLRETYADLRVILTGGDSERFESFIKGPIFARPEIVLKGLNKILEYNEVV